MPEHPDILILVAGVTPTLVFIRKRSFPDERFQQSAFSKALKKTSC